jgi:hypothetical protein
VAATRRAQFIAAAVRSESQFPGATRALRVAGPTGFPKGERGSGSPKKNTPKKVLFLFFICF